MLYFLELPLLSYTNNPTPQPAYANSPAATHNKPNMSNAKLSNQTDGQSLTYSQSDHRAATLIQSLWRGYATRNLDSKVQEMKVELRCRRLEEALMFVIGEMNR